jgi:hypothetical protein
LRFPDLAHPPCAEALEELVSTPDEHVWRDLHGVRRKTAFSSSGRIIPTKFERSARSAE